MVTGWDNHAGFGTLHAVHGSGLVPDGKVTVNHADISLSGDGHSGPVTVSIFAAEMMGMFRLMRLTGERRCQPEAE